MLRPYALPKQKLISRKLDWLCGNMCQKRDSSSIPGHDEGGNRREGDAHTDVSNPCIEELHRAMTAWGSAELQQRGSMFLYMLRHKATQVEPWNVKCNDIMQHAFHEDRTLPGLGSVGGVQ